MNHIASIRQRLAIAAVVTVQLLGLSLFSLPVTTYADTAPCPPTSGTSAPTGSAAHTFTFDQETCTYENAYYSWSPYTKVYVPKYSQDHVLNADGTAYEYPQWDYSPAKGKYVLRMVSVPLPTVTAPTEGVTTTSSPAQANGNGAGSETTGGNTINNTGADSTNNINSANNTNGTINLTNNTSVITTLDSTAISGNASVLQNTNGGSAATGDATAIANYLALIQSGWNPAGGVLSTFNADLYGSFTGDLLFDPNLILDTGSGSTNTINSNDTTNLHVVVQDDASIDNTINLTAKSGDATVSENTNGGDATTGDATAVANLVNMINSSINSQKGFIGTVNIHGDLNGDFLLPPALLAQLQNTGPGSSNSILQNNDTNVDAKITNNAAIINNFNIGAISGNATVDQNTNAGSAATGNASTNVEQQNYVGVNGNGQKGLLVFVNVMGQWVGFVNPNFATIGNTGPNSTNSIASNNDTNLNFDITQDHSITNNINLSAQSGDATVTKNTNAGSATTGNAFAGANVLNLIDSNLNYDDWFGVLFINVFGSWSGSFGTDTTAGGKGYGQVVNDADERAERQPQFFASSAMTAPGESYIAKRVAAAAHMTGSDNGSPAVLGSTTDDTAPPTATSQQPAAATTQEASGFVINWGILAIGALIGVGYAMRKQELDFVRALTGRVR